MHTNYFRPANPTAMKKVLFLAALFTAASTRAQLTITDSLSVGSLTSLLQGLNITISNLTVNCAGSAFGEFNGVSEIPITHGLVMTSGGADLVAGPNMSSSHTATPGTPGDVDLEALIGGGTTTHDACVLEFDCTPLGDTLLFNFSFGSEEYLEFVGSSFNDVFAIWLTGPGFPIPTNVAAIPGGTPVSINNVNATTNPAYYVNNETPPGMHCALDGFTQNLTAFAVVTPGATYHFKVAVADVSDGIFDSAVLLEAFSFRSVMSVSTGIAATDPNTIALNEADGSLQISFAGEASEGRIIDALGRTMCSFELVAGAAQVPVADLASGQFIVAIGPDVRATFHHVRNER